MKKVILACDLDNTLIHSYKHKSDDDICIELIKEKEQGFINEKAREMIGLLTRNVVIIPVTTRSVEQYLRIQWEKIIECKYAVTSNGAILLNNGEKDDSWLKESRIILGKYKDELTRVLSLLKQEKDYIRCRTVDEMYVFSYCKEGVDIDNKVRFYRENTSLEVISSGKKIYFFPPQFNKGHALQRLKERLFPDYVIAAGDTEIDIPMLNRADMAFCKKGIIDRVDNKNKICFTNERNLIELVMSI